MFCKRLNSRHLPEIFLNNSNVLFFLRFKLD